MDSRQPCHLVRLPPELTSQILYHVFYSFCDIDMDYHTVFINYADDLRSGRAYGADFFGTRRMSAILAINSRLHAEAEYVLFSRFTFEFMRFHGGSYSQLIAPADVAAFLKRISPRAKSFVRRIRVTIEVDAGQAADGVVAAGNVKACRRAFNSLVRAFPRLKFVEIWLSIAGPLEYDAAWEGTLVEQICFLTGTFRTVEEIKMRYGGGSYNYRRYPQNKRVENLAMERVERRDWGEWEEWWEDEREDWVPWLVQQFSLQRLIQRRPLSALTGWLHTKLLGLCS